MRHFYLANVHASSLNCTIKNAWLNPEVYFRKVLNSGTESINSNIWRQKKVIIEGIEEFSSRKSSFWSSDWRLLQSPSGAFACFSCILKRLLNKMDHHDFSKMIPILWVNCNFPNWVICIRPGLFWVNWCFTKNRFFFNLWTRSW